MSNKQNDELNEMIEENKKELVVTQPDQSNIAKFGSMNPKDLVKKGTEMANALAPIIDEKKLYTSISGKKYVRAEGWTTMLAMLGIMPQVEWSKRLDRENEIVYESRVILKTMTGTVVSAAEALCSSKEKNWSNRDEFAIKSMAQTRATGKAARLPFAWIMSLAGYEGTPAEEIIYDMVENTKPAEQPAQPDKLATAKQIKLIYDLAKDKLEAQDAPQAMFSIGAEMNIKDPDIKTMTSMQAHDIIEFLMGYNK